MLDPNVQEALEKDLIIDITTHRQKERRRPPGRDLVP